MVNLTVGYKDSIGLQGSYYSSLPASLQSTVTTATATSAISSGITSLNLLEYGIVGILVVVVIVGAILVRRNRRGTGAAYHEPEEREDKAVI